MGLTLISETLTTKIIHSTATRSDVICINKDIKKTFKQKTRAGQVFCLTIYFGGKASHYNKT